MRFRHVFRVTVGDQQIARHGWHQGARQQERADQREQHRLGHGREQEAGNAGQEEHRHKGDADAQQRYQSRHHDLLRAIENRLMNVFALLQMPIDILDGHRGVIHQDADRQGQAA